MMGTKILAFGVALALCLAPSSLFGEVFSEYIIGKKYVGDEEVFICKDLTSAKKIALVFQEKGGLETTNPAWHQDYSNKVAVTSTRPLISFR